MKSSHQVSRLSSRWVLIAALATVGTTACLSIMSSKLGFAELLNLRYIFVIGVSLFLLRISGISILSKHWKIHLMRFAAGIGAVSTYVWIATQMPIATVTALQYTSPIFISCFLLASAVLRNDRPEWRFLALILMAFLGVFLMLQPAAVSVSLTLIGLACGFFNAASILLLRELGKRGEPIVRTVFIYSVLGLLFSFVLNAVYGSWHFSEYCQPTFFIMLALTAVAQYARTKGWGSCNANLGAIFQFSGLPFSVILDCFLFSIPLLPQTTFGMAIISLSSCLTILILLRKRSNTSSD